MFVRDELKNMEKLNALYGEYKERNVQLNFLHSFGSLGNYFLDFPVNEVVEQSYYNETKSRSKAKWKRAFNALLEEKFACSYQIEQLGSDKALISIGKESIIILFHEFWGDIFFHKMKGKGFKNVQEFLK